MGFFDSLFGKKQEQPKPETTATKEEAFTLPEEYRDLTPRDTRKPKAYFAEILKNIAVSTKSDIPKYDEYIAKNNPTGIRMMGDMLSQDIYAKIYAAYNIGKPITNEWVGFYKDYFKFYVSSIHQQSVPYESIKILSIGILLGVETSYFQKISKKLIEEDYRDYVIETLIASQYPEHPISKNVLFPNGIMTQSLKKIIDTENRTEAEQLVKAYLENTFYNKKILNEAYNSHKRDDGLYNGYWSLDSAVLVKIKGLDDGSFKDNPYYPYDLVHWQNRPAA